jgi:hypothetical protein
VYEYVGHQLMWQERNNATVSAVRRGPVRTVEAVMRRSLS